MALDSPATNRWSESGLEIRPGHEYRDDGDLRLSDEKGARDAIERAIARILASGGLPLSLGGDHSVTYPIVRALGRVAPQFTIVQIDAHPDLYDEFEGDRFSHACPFARILEEHPGIRLVQVGIRTMTGHQREQARRFGVDVIDMRAWVAGRRPELSGPTYVTIDVDGLDPAFAPGVSHPEPGGLSSRDVLGILQSLPGPILGADVVEVNPTRDVGNATVAVAAKLVREAIALIHHAEQPPDPRASLASQVRA
jgi:agmatinase